VIINSYHLRFLTLLLMLTVFNLSLTVAQQTPFVCTGNQTYSNTVTVNIPQPDPQGNLIFTAMGATLDQNPVLFMDNGSVPNGLCNVQGDNAPLYALQLPDQEEVAFSNLHAQQISSFAESITLGISDIGTFAGQYVLMIESQTAQARGDRIEFLIDAPLLDTHFQVYAIGQNRISLAFTDGEGEPFVDENDSPLACTSATCEPVDSFFMRNLIGTVDSPNNVTQLSYQATADDAGRVFGIDVSDGEGFYTLVIAFDVSENVAVVSDDESTEDVSLKASVVQTETTFELTCGEVVATNGVRLAFPDLAPDTDYQATLMGGFTLDPLIIWERDGEFFCQDEVKLDELGNPPNYSLDLPYIQTSMQPTSVQIQFEAGDILYIGAHEETASGGWALIVEGLSVEVDTYQTVELTINEMMQRIGAPIWMSVLGFDNVFDSYIQQIDESGEAVTFNDEPIYCNDAGFVGDCNPIGDSLDRVLFRLGDTELLGFVTDATLLPLANLTEIDPIIVQMGMNPDSELTRDSTGRFIFVIYLILQ